MTRLFPKRPDPPGVLKDPFHVSIIRRIESAIRAVDKSVSTGDFLLSDSVVNSALHKLIARARGESSALPAGGKREQALAKLIESVDALRPDLVDKPHPEAKDKTMTIDHWAASLKSILASLKANSGGAPGSRGYLTWLEREREKEEAEKEKAREKEKASSAKGS